VKASAAAPVPVAQRTSPEPIADRGSAVAEFSLVSVLLVLLVLAVAQVAVYLWVRNVTAAAAADGARFAAPADAASATGADRAQLLLEQSVGAGTVDRISCSSSEVPGDGGLVLVEVRCAGRIPVFFAPLGHPLPLDVTGRAIKETP
jgi:hypothetical protein